ncbi:SDR family oxidoreductase [Fulvivirga maritima]|uniref:SDR family oxidoreductase n=1 Tax=Fulvivirga maritima TaxID=2904247 RepID=UPI001F3F09F9|nr:SDR family oxidoreductase [Fulvivirga maritima]UII26926.1 SDR family oxidoreductase [Fulvivirga maritima]
MKIFVTGASGFIGSAVVSELINSGHQVLGLARSEASSIKISDAGAEPLKGDLKDLESLKQGASQADGVIHTAFIHDFSQYLKAGDIDQKAIKAIGEVLEGTNKPLVVTSGLLGLPLINGYITEESILQNGPRSSEPTTLALAEEGINASVVRLPPSVHGKGDQGFIPFIINQAKKNGISAYPEDGNNLWPAVHRLDAARLFRLAIEKPHKGAVYNAVGDQGITLKSIAELIAQKLDLAATSVSGEKVTEHFEWMSRFIGFDNPATCVITSQLLNWQPSEIDLLQDMNENYF